MSHYKFVAAIVLDDDPCGVPDVCGCTSLGRRGCRTTSVPTKPHGAWRTWLWLRSSGAPWRIVPSSWA
eukprot:316174-Alexandrium_andersonii.AAC.1